MGVCEVVWGMVCRMVCGLLRVGVLFGWLVFFSKIEFSVTKICIEKRKCLISKMFNNKNV